MKQQPKQRNKRNELRTLC